MSTEAPPLHRREVLINPRFQLKYAGTLVLIVGLVTLVLGFVIAKTADTATQYADLAASQSERAVKESQANSKLARMNVAIAAQDNPELLRMMDEELKKTDQQAALDLERVRAQREQIALQRQRMIDTLAIAGVVLLSVLFVLAIWVTQKVVGPVHKLKKLLRRVSTGRLVVSERLRRGDELGDLFDTFLQMTWSLRAQQSGRVATLDDAIRKAEATNADPDLKAILGALHAQMTLGLRTRRESEAPPR
jgi:nitrogen fixation/metabolism regulation signal transduction histidine kinase